MLLGLRALVPSLPADGSHGAVPQQLTADSEAHSLAVKESAGETAHAVHGRTQFTFLFIRVKGCH